MVKHNVMAGKKDFSSIFELASKGFSIKHYSRSVPIIHVILFYAITLLFLMPLAFFDPWIRVFVVLFVLLGTIFIAVRFITHKEDFVSEEIGLEYAKLAMGAKDAKDITEGEIIEGVQPVFEEKKILPKQKKQKKGVAARGTKK